MQTGLGVEKTSGGMTFSQDPPISGPDVAHRIRTQVVLPVPAHRLWPGRARLQIAAHHQTSSRARPLVLAPHRRRRVLLPLTFPYQRSLAAECLVTIAARVGGGARPVGRG